MKAADGVSSGEARSPNAIGTSGAQARTDGSASAQRGERRKKARIAAPAVAPVPAAPVASHTSGAAFGRASSPSADRMPSADGRVMELHWGDSEPPSRGRGEGLVQRWVKRGDALLRHLAEHGAARHEYRADLKEGRFVWLDDGGRVSAEAEAQVLCSWSKSTSVIAMAWADPLVRASGVARIDGMPAERDDADEETAWRVAMQAADAAKAEYLYRVTTPHAWYFLALRKLTFSPERASFTPSTPVGLVLKMIAETRQAIESRAEPAAVVRERLSNVGQALLHEARYAYRDTDWVARLSRTGRRLTQLGERLPRPSYASVAAGRHASEWLGRDATIELSQAMTLLEDEWALFT